MIEDNLTLDAFDSDMEVTCVTECSTLYLSISPGSSESVHGPLMGASCAVGPLSAASTSEDTEGTVPKSHGSLLLGTVPAAS